MRTYKICKFALLLFTLVMVGVPPTGLNVQAQGGISPATAKAITVGACASVTMNDSAANTDPGTAIIYLNTIAYSNTASPLHDWYTFELTKADNVNIEITRTNTSARLDLWLFAIINRPSHYPEGLIPIDFSVGAATAATQIIGPRRLEAGKYYIGIRAQTGTSAYTLKVTRGLDTTQALFVDHRVIGATLSAGGVLLMNKFTPTRYPATLNDVSVTLHSPTGSPNISGQFITLEVRLDPSSLGKPPAGAVTPAVSRQITLPQNDYIAASRTVATMGLGLQIASGDLYVGYRLPVNMGMGVRFDTDGLKLDATFISRDGGATFSVVTLTDSGGVPTPAANAVIRVASLSLPVCVP